MKIYAADNLIRGAHHTPMSPLVKGERIIDICFEVVFLFRWIALPVIRTGSFSAILSVTISFDLGPFTPFGL